MPPSLDELAAQLAKETDYRERAIKYAHNMMEDLKQAFADFGIASARFEGRFDQHVKDDERTALTIDKVYADVKSLTRLVYIGVGGVIVVGGMLAVVGERILNLLSHG